MPEDRCEEACGCARRSPGSRERFCPFLGIFLKMESVSRGVRFRADESGARATSHHLPFWFISPPPPPPPPHNLLSNHFFPFLTHLSSCSPASREFLAYDDNNSTLRLDTTARTARQLIVTTLGGRLPGPLPVQYILLSLME